MLTVLLLILIVLTIKAQSPPAPDESAEAVPPVVAGGASLFERPDEWSRVLCELPEDAVVTYGGEDGRFLRVTTADNLVGYVLASACIPDADTNG